MTFMHNPADPPDRGMSPTLSPDGFDTVKEGSSGPVVRPIERDSAEWNDLLRQQAIGQQATGIYSKREVRAMTEGDFRASWLTEAAALLAALGVEAQGQLAGWIHVWGRADDTAVLESLFVSPDHRGRGLARQLVRAAAATASDNDFPMIEVHAIEQEVRAVAFWRRLFEAAPTLRGEVQLCGRKLPAQGWRLRPSELARITVGSHRPMS
jgi:ribosomal protein S18 acetylase RimI-like enzyme